MAEIPEHLLKRAQEARQRADAQKGGGADEAESAGSEAESSPLSQASSDGPKIPEHLLDRSKSARAQAAGASDRASADVAGGGASAVTTTPVPAASAQPEHTGPGGGTQRLLTVVKSGSIQDVKATPTDKVHVWPHLLVIEFVAALLVTAFTLLFSIFVNAPLLELANVNETPNPSKAPWYFLGLQELLTMFHPMVAGVTIPGMGLFLLMLAPYMDRNPSKKPEDRKFAISLMTVHLMFWAILVLIGSFFRGPGFNFVFPWVDGLFFDL
ncbi:MAG: menaquinol-cytochrome c reductase cytochrome b subunit [Acidimicrobiia bacterium]|nr:menaquinol-cytochrome c reductase cytochrome b subunit [Acidimicrobiia bacterium]MYC57692.1 menaquinol-cytochrome c reductase cytochrome b subunit [Acidimicrobiia bacterium]MYG93596.1 menaquinol-cytochrome c reductase cytochrome b subunit [Acidimicrobiia bacterium]MYI30891.1 menaquinol-cytochrome c reductase cytochrome b subunit [Acidimicrobiia bacterium]